MPESRHWRVDLAQPTPAVDARALRLGRASRLFVALTGVC